MTLKEAIILLENHQKWRLGAKMAMAKPKAVTEALNVVLKFTNKVQKLSNE